MKKPRLDKPAKEPKAPKAEKPKPKIVNMGDNSVDPDTRALFLSDKEKWKRLDDAVKKATGARRAHEKAVKGDGFLLTQIKFVVACEAEGGEEEERSKIANNLLAARYCGLSLGTQMELFLEPDRTPAIDRAYDEGAQASMESKTANPPYDPSTPQYQEWLRGFNDDTERRISAGIKPLDDGPPPRSSDMH